VTWRTEKDSERAEKGEGSGRERGMEVWTKREREGGVQEGGKVIDQKEGGRWLNRE
jgi:hypothetical protein